MARFPLGGGGGGRAVGWVHQAYLKTKTYFRQIL